MEAEEPYPVWCLKCGRKFIAGDRAFEVTVGQMIEHLDGSVYFDPSETTYNLCECQENREEKIRLAIQNIEEYIPEFIMEEGEPTPIPLQQVRPDPKRIYHPESSVNSFREDLINLLKHGKLGVEVVNFEEEE